MSAEPKRGPGRPRKQPLPVIAPEELREAGRNAAEQGADAAGSPAIAPLSADPVPGDAVALADYIARLEGSRMAEGVVLVHVSHPSATGEIFPGKYSGVRTSQGPLWAQWSDGAKTDA